MLRFIKEKKNQESFLLWDEGNRREETEFERSGLNAGQLERMDSEKRRSVLKEAGLNPWEYDF